MAALAKTFAALQVRVKEHTSLGHLTENNHKLAEHP